MTTSSDKTTNAVWIVGDLRTQRLWRQSLKVMAKARPLAEQAGAPVTMLLLGATDRSEAQSRTIDLSACVSMEDAAREAVAHGAQTVYCIDHPLLAIPRTDSYARVLADLVEAKKPWLILTALTDFGRETAAFCAQRCQAGLIADCDELILKDQQVVGRCPAWGGQILADITLAQGWPTAFVTVQPHGVSLDDEASGDGRVETIVPDRIDMPRGLQLLACAMEPAAARRLEQADIVVAGGAGLGDMRGFGLVRELAAALGGEVGATRPPVMNHWVEEERLIGQTGKSVRPRLLFSVGTSGAIQYTAGIMEADTIVAINRDASAPIFQIADIGLVGDGAALLPLITRHAKQAAMRRLADAACSIDGQQDQPQGGFGAMVRQLREARNWSVDEMARKTGQTPDFVQQVEADQMSPPVAFILRMAQAMEVDPGTFLSKKEQAAIRDRRAQAYHQRTRNYSYTTLTPDAENSHLRAFMVTIEPYLAHKPVAYKHEGEEFIFVMSGELEFTLGAKVHVLKTGESIHFNSDVPHKLKSRSSDVTRCLVVLYTI
ncbi:MAG: FAD-binding protein [Desulfobacteraceae bacterium]|jgi:electron transfer flavoprotein alpha subunit/transcriptional regulator with XRE-family HTH domain